MLTLLKQKFYFVPIGALVLVMLMTAGCDSQRRYDEDDGPLVEDSTRPRAFHIVGEVEEWGSPKGSFTVMEVDGAAGGKCLGIPLLGKDFDGEKGELAWSVNAPAAGPIHVWLRVLWSGTCANSVYLSLPDGSQAVVGENETYKTWHWVKLARELELPAGQAKFVLHQREDDIRIDQVLITSDADYVPVGIEQE